MASLCDKCVALCCRYFALPIDNPTTLRDYDNIRWYLIHENVVVFVTDKQWYIGVMTKCKHLQADHRCGIYDVRPRICREFSTDNCDYHGDEYEFELLFTSADQLVQYAEKTLSKKKGRKVKLILDTSKPKLTRRVSKGKVIGISLPVLPFENGAGAGPRKNGESPGSKRPGLPLI